MSATPAHIAEAHRLADFYGVALKSRALELRRLISRENRGRPEIFVIEQGFLQSRKIVELIAYFGRLSHLVAGIQVNSRAESYNANEVMKWLERASGVGFPTAIDIVPDETGQTDGMFVDATDMRDCLDAAFAKRVYVESGNVLHQDQVVPEISVSEARVEMLRRMTSKSFNLLERFEMTLPEAKWMLTGQLHLAQPSRRPEVFLSAPV